ncbi:MAG: hypothetical protein WC389_15135 [Lutibacter sp.]|jgi:hypothetical protein
MKKLFKKIAAFAVKVWSAVGKAFNKLDEEAKEHIGAVIQIIQTVKDVIKEGSFTGSLLDIVVAKTPVPWDNIALMKVREWLPILIIKLTYTDIILHAGTTEEQIAKAVDIIRLFDDDQKEVFFDGLAKEILKYSSDGQITWRDANAIIKYAFDNGYWNK